MSEPDLSEEGRLRMSEPYEDDDGVQHDGWWVMPADAVRRYKAKHPEAEVEFRWVSEWREEPPLPARDA